MDQQPPDVAVAAFADTEERGLAAGRVFPRYKAEPCSEVTPSSELTAVAYGCEQRSGAKRPDAGNGHEPTRTIVSSSEPLDLSGDAGDALIELDNVFEEFGQLFRLYRQERLAVRRRGGRKRAMGTRAPITLPLQPNQRWSLDFVSDQLLDGRRFRILTVVDDCPRECLALFADTSLSGMRVARELDQLIATRGKPATIVSAGHEPLALQSFASVAPRLLQRSTPEGTTSLAALGASSS